MRLFSVKDQNVIWKIVVVTIFFGWMALPVSAATAGDDSVQVASQSGGEPGDLKDGEGPSEGIDAEEGIESEGEDDNAETIPGQAHWNGTNKKNSAE